MPNHSLAVAADKQLAPNLSACESQPISNVSSATGRQYRRTASSTVGPEKFQKKQPTLDARRTQTAVSAQPDDVYRVPQLNGRGRILSSSNEVEHPSTTEGPEETLKEFVEPSETQREKRKPTFVKREFLEHEIAKHGMPFLLQKRESKHASVGINEVRRIASELKENKSIAAIRMISCHAAVGGPFSNAQMLANATGKRVFAYSSKVSRASSTRLPSIRFQPQGPIKAAITAKVHQALGESYRGLRRALRLGGFI